MLDGEILQKVKRILAGELDIDLLDIEPISELVNDLGADSLTIWEVSMQMEDVFDIEIEEGEYYNVISVQDLVGIVEKKIQQ